MSQKIDSERYLREEKVIARKQRVRKPGDARVAGNFEEKYLRTYMGIFKCLLKTASDFSDLVLYGNNPNHRDLAVFPATGVRMPTG